MEELRTMSSKELDRAGVMARLVERTLSQRAAAEILQMTVRQARRCVRSPRPTCPIRGETARP
jgi:hypothetical protein